MLKNDCFALPPGVNWIPVDEALARLRAGLTTVALSEIVPLGAALGRYLAQDLTAPASHPPFANVAVDGYGFARPAVWPEEGLPLAEGRAAAGAPYGGTLPEGHALRVLTGAQLPQGVDTVVLEEEARIEAGRLHLPGLPKSGANIRPAGEDVRAGDVFLTAGTQLGAGEIALLASVGMVDIPVRRRLRVALMATGDELIAPGTARAAGQIYDANRPMLAACLAAWGYELVDLGQIADDRDRLRAAFDQGAACDAILVSGGASAGDEDHVSALLQAEGQMTAWRIALKPGRPLALAQWAGVPVFGLPGNPVAAFVCALLFARPALQQLAGGDWPEPEPVMLAAAFSKRKKPGRSEVLRAQRRGDQVAIFPSEGSGRVSSLAFADGLVLLGPEAREITPGDPAPYLPLTAFGL